MPTRPSACGLWCRLLISCALLSGPVVAGEAPSFDTLPAYASADVPLSAFTPARRTGRLTLPLPSGERVTFHAGPAQLRADGTSLTAVRSDAGRLVVTVDGRRAYGHLVANGRLYSIDTIDGKTRLLDADRVDEPVNTGWRNDAVVDRETTTRLFARSAKPGVALLETVEPRSSVDLAIFVEDAVQTRYGAQAVRTRVQAWVDFTNEAFRLTGLPITLRLVYVGRFTGVLPEGGDVFGAFQRDAAAAQLARAYGADLRHLVYSYPAHSSLDYCGRGMLAGDAAMTAYECGEHRFAHEIGHNFGAHHDRANVPSGDVEPGAYNFGYLCGGRGTLMSYVGAAALDHFSTPNLSFNGQACGVAIGQPDAAFNGAAIDAHRALVAAFAPAPVIAATVRFAQDLLTVDERGPALPVAIVREGDISGEASVEVGIVDGTAREGEDVRPLLQRVTFAPGESVRQLTLEPIDDEAFDAPEESLRVVLRYPQGASVSGAPLEVRIVGSDDADHGQVTFTSATRTVNENAGIVRVQISRAGNADSALGFEVQALDETAHAGTDYRLMSGSAPAQLTFAPGERLLSVDVEILDDLVNQGTDAYRYFSLRLVAPDLGVQPEQRIYVMNDDEATAADASVKDGGGASGPALLIGLLAALAINRRRSSLQANVSRADR